MSLLRFFGLGGADTPADPRDDTETVRRISAQLDRLDPKQATFLAGFAYVLARIANADLTIDDAETAEMERIVKEVAELADGEAALVVQIAKSQTRLLGETENYVVTRQFREVSTREQRGQLLECLYAVAAADGAITGDETAEVANVANELGFTRAEANALRSAFKDKLSELRKT